MTNKTLDELQTLIESWAIKRQLHNKDYKLQALKLVEEVGELASGVLKGNIDETIDAVGDIFVVLTVFCLQHRLDFQTCVDSAYNVIKDRTGKMQNGVFVKDE